VIGMKLSQDVKPVSYFKNNMAEVLRRLNENQGTMIITQNGEAKAAILDIQAYEDLQETLAMLEMVAQGNKSMAEGKYRPADQVLKEFEERIEKDFS
jgi:prevent-host-death family protein